MREAVSAANPDVKVDTAGVPEILARLAAAPIEGDQPRVERRHEDPRATWRACGARGVHPGGHAACRHLIMSKSDAIDVGVVRPPRCSTLRIERDHARRWSGDVQGAVEHERRCLERGGRTTAVRGTVGDITRAKYPGHAQRVHVRPRDLVERGVVGAADGAIRRPVRGGCRTGARPGRCEHADIDGRRGERGCARGRRIPRPSCRHQNHHEAERERNADKPATAVRCVWHGETSRAREPVKSFDWSQNARSDAAATYAHRRR